MQDEQQVGRRPFLGAATWLIGALISAVYAIPGVAYLLAPALEDEEAGDWLSLGSTSKVELGIPTLFKTTIERQTGWISNQEEVTAYVLTENGRDFVAFSNICSHLGCRVRWIDDRGEFFCPCHNGVFAKDGTVLEGPPPRPLDQFEVRVVDDQIEILGG
jgi:menaquinol-cytochrome c reductase iron-sulfur subunit